MTKEEAERIQKAGANSRAINGAHIKRNPYYDSASMPAKTGDSLEHWQAKADAWELGWALEHATRS